MRLEIDLAEASTLTAKAGIASDAPPPAVVVSGVFPPATLQEMRRLFALREMSADALRAGAGLPGVEILVTDPGVGADAPLMAKLPDLKLVACYGVGVDALDLKEAARRGVSVTNTPGLLSDDVADMALTLMLASARNLLTYDGYVRDGRWTTIAAAVPLGRSLSGKTAGIVGLGRIGAAIAGRAEAFGMTILYNGPRPKPDVRYGFEPDLTSLARKSDFLIVACRGGAETRGLVSHAVIEALGPKGTLVNVARGSVVDEAALVAALADGRLGFAALDVFADEPRVPDVLRSMPNVVLSPHQGSATTETRLALGQLVIDNMTAFAQGRALPTPVVPAGR